MTEKKKDKPEKTTYVDTDWSVMTTFPTTVCPKLAQKIFEVMNGVPVVAKLGRNKAQGYDYLQEVDVIKAVKPLLKKHRLIVLKIAEQYKNTPVHLTKSGVGQTLTELCTTFRWIDIDTGHYIDTQQIGTGIDTGDKGSYNATTGAKKYNLTTNLFIATGDDPEGDNKTDENNPPETNTVLATDKQTAFLNRLVSEREVDFGLSAEIDNKIRDGILSIGEAKEYIDQLLKLPKLEDSRVSK